jgi:hypothetical protein
MTTENDVAAKLPTDLLGEAKSAASKVAHTATEQIEHRLDSEKNRAVEAIGGVADALRQTGERRTTPGPAAALAGRAADGIDDVADYLQSRSLRDVVGEVERFARREPAIFLGAAFTLGLVGGRFLKSSANRKRELAEREEAAAAERNRALNPAYGRLPQAWRASDDHGPSSAGASSSAARSAAIAKSAGSSAPSAQPGPGPSPRPASSASSTLESDRTSAPVPDKGSKMQGSIGMDASNIGSPKLESSSPSGTGSSSASPASSAAPPLSSQAALDATSLVGMTPALDAQPNASKTAAASSTSSAAGAESHDQNESKGGDKKGSSGPRVRS